MSDPPVLRVEDLRVGYRGGDADVEIVSGVSFELRARRGARPRRRVGLRQDDDRARDHATARPRPAPLSGTIDLATENGVVHVHRRTERGMRDLRWTEISLVFQGALNALDPVQRISRQIGDAIRLHDPEADRTPCASAWASCSSGSASARARRPVPARVLRRHAPARDDRARAGLRSEVVIADEPTTALDVMTQAQVLALLEELRRDLGLALLLITHDLGVIAETCERVAVMYAGRIVETGPTETVSARRSTRTRSGCWARSRRSAASASLPPAIPGAPPDPADPPSGCRFHPRCHLAREVCAHGEVSLRPVGEDHESACLFAPLTQAPAGGAVR